MPAVEAGRAVEPDGVIEAEAGEPPEARPVWMGPENDVHQEEVAGVGEERGVQRLVVANVFGEPHPVRPGPNRSGPAEESRRLGHAHLER